MPAPWAPAPDLDFVLAGSSVKRDEIPALRRQAALATLARMRAENPPDVEIFSDGAAVEGRRDGVGGAVVVWTDNRRAPRSAHRAAGIMASSTRAEAVGADLALEMLEEDLETFDQEEGKLIIWIAFDSRALFQKLSRAWRCAGEPTCLSIIQRLHRLGQKHAVRVIWVPGHAGLEGNEAADRAAAEGASSPQSDTATMAQGVVSGFLREQSSIKFKEWYETANNMCHLTLSGAEPLSIAEFTRSEVSVLCQLRSNRAPFLRATKFRHGREASAECPHCGADTEDSLHLVLECPHYRMQRLEVFGNPPEPASLRNPRRLLQFLRGCALF